jgi:hypothetical protein
VRSENPSWKSSIIYPATYFTSSFNPRLGSITPPSHAKDSDRSVGCGRSLVASRAAPQSQLTMKLSVDTLRQPETPSTVGSSNSSGSSFGEDGALWSTPRNGSNKLRSLFADDESCPSPPKVNGEEVDMYMYEVESRMRGLVMIPGLLKLISQDKYKKACLWTWRSRNNRGSSGFP